MTVIERDKCLLIPLLFIFCAGAFAANPVRNSRMSKLTPLETQVKHSLTERSKKSLTGLIRQGKISNGANDKLPNKPPGKFFPLRVKDHRSTDSFKSGQPIIGTTYFYWYDTFTLMWMTHSLMNCSAGRSWPVGGPPPCGNPNKTPFLRIIH